MALAGGFKIRIFGVAYQHERLASPSVRHSHSVTWARCAEANCVGRQILMRGLGTDAPLVVSSCLPALLIRP